MFAEKRLMMTSSTSMTRLTTAGRTAGRAERQSMGGKMYARNAKMNRVLDRSKKIEKAALQIKIQLQAVNRKVSGLEHAEGPVLQPGQVIIIPDPMMYGVGRE